MNLIPWKKKQGVPVSRQVAPPPTTIAELRREMNDLFERFTQDPWLTRWEPTWTPEAFGRFGDLTPSVDVSENDKCITVRAEMPGLAPEDIDIHVAGRILTLSGEKKESTEEERDDYYHCERRFGAFRRSIELPSSADPDHVDAEMKSGVLVVTVGKMADAKTKRVKVKGGEKVSMAGTPV